MKPSTAFDPSVTGVLVTKPTDKEACIAAKGLSNDEPDNSKGCPSFQKVTSDKCRGLGVILK
ncbi:hypothetical protein [Roseomonas gilardii]|uniref:hypothetical protein n=1 Tax=Roseomonas gilardii TaxID=257708 RepID=UPI00119F8039|nr:hypothetical protein [Roseomonas gilardii]